MPEEAWDREELVTRLVRHGARRVETKDLLREGVLVWRLPAERPLSTTCIKLEEFMSSAARNCRAAINVIGKN